MPRSISSPFRYLQQTVGVVTAPTGAAIRDITNITGRRNPLCAADPLSGAGAGRRVQRHSIVAGNPYPGQNGTWMCSSWAGAAVPLKICGRSMRKMWRGRSLTAITPVISAVGHETDVTIADYVADLRAPTPSAAAELAVFDYRQFEAARLVLTRTSFNQAVARKDQMTARARAEQYRLRLNSCMTHRANLREQRQHACRHGGTSKACHGAEAKTGSTSPAGTSWRNGCMGSPRCQKSATGLCAM